jgi:hypothetical protein
VIYVDDMFFPRGDDHVSNLFSDESLEELHAFAEWANIHPEYFDGNSRLPHYDVSSFCRQAAILRGARLVHFGSEEWGQAVKRARGIIHVTV